MIKGIVRSLPKGKSFGFIQVGMKDLFFHKDDFHGDWKQLNHDFKYGEHIHVECEETETPKGLRAANVNRISKEN